MFTASAGSKQTNRFLPEAKHEHAQNKALRCDPILIEVDGKTPTGFSSVGSAPDWGCYWKGSWARWVSRNLSNENWKPLDVFLSRLWAEAHPAANPEEEEIQPGVCKPGTAAGRAAPLPPLWATGKGSARQYLSTLCPCAFLHKEVQKWASWPLLQSAEMSACAWTEVNREDGWATFPWPTLQPVICHSLSKREMEPESTVFPPPWLQDWFLQKAKGWESSGPTARCTRWPSPQLPMLRSPAHSNKALPCVCSFLLFPSFCFPWKRQL